MVETSSTDNLPIIFDEDTNDETSIISFGSSITSHNAEQNYFDGPNEDIPNIIRWDKYKVHQYLSARGLPETVTKKIIDNVSSIKPTIEKIIFINLCNSIMFYNF